MTSYQSIISTRSRNKNVHPGQVIIDSSQQRRTAGEMKIARLKRQHELDKNNQQKIDQVQCILAIQGTLAEEDCERSQPTPTPSTWPPPYAPTICPPHIPGQRSTQTGPLPSNSHRSNSPNDGNYIPDPEEGKSEKDDSDSSEIGVEEREVTEAPSNPSRKKQKVDRAAIVAAAAAQPSVRQDSRPAGLMSAATKRKGKALPPATRPMIKKPCNQPNPTIPVGTSLLPGWDQQRPPPIPVGGAPPTLNDEEDLMVSSGGFFDDNELDQIECPALGSVASKKILVKSMIKVSAPRPAQTQTKKQKHGGAAKWNLSHLGSADTAREFTNTLAPAAHCKIRTVPAWSSLSVSDVQELVDAVYPDNNFVVDEDGPWMGLIAYCMSNWRNGFLQHAQDAVSTFINLEKDEDPELNISEFVTHYITPQGNPPTRPFEYRQWYINPNTSKIIKHGRLQNRMVMSTLAKAHFAEFDTISDPSTLPQVDLPCGALVLAHQAVEHVLKSWQTSEYQHDGRPASFFSTDNYADKLTTKLVNGQHVKTLVPVAGRYKPTIDSLSIGHWQDIFGEVADILKSVEKKSKKGHQSASSEASSDYIVDESSLVMISSDD